ncbi:MAG: hypothetical protein ACOX8R_07625 [Bacillota bacterium]
MIEKSALVEFSAGSTVMLNGFAKTGETDTKLKIINTVIHKKIFLRKFNCLHLQKKVGVPKKGRP